VARDIETNLLELLIRTKGTENQSDKAQELQIPQ
jgi:hypothetical protein